MQSKPSAPPPAPEYLTMAENRTYNQRWKFHTNLGHAKNALRVASQYGKVAELYQWNGTEFVLIYRIEEDTGEVNLPWLSDQHC